MFEQNDKNVTNMHTVVMFVVVTGSSGYFWPKSQDPSLTSSNGNIFCITVPLWREFTGRQWWIPLTKASDLGVLMFSLICAWTNSWANHCDASDLRCHHAQYDVTAVISMILVIHLLWNCPQMNDFWTLLMISSLPSCRDHFVNVPNQWETTLHCNIVSYWLGAFTKRSLKLVAKILATDFSFVLDL